ncbi:uncharacterized protein LOC144121046 [Amblyomma americanum]
MARVSTGRTIKFSNVQCDECGQHPIIGSRWKCDVCHDYDLCTACYLSGKHTPRHSFVHFDAPQREGIKVASKHGSRTEPNGDAISRANDVTFEYVSCDDCEQRQIVGPRWKCAVCFNFDLCTACYRRGKHSLDHVFLRIDVPGGTAVQVPPRRRPVRAGAIMFQGIYCDSCDQRPISGTRWKCALCVDYDLCTSCYVGGKHNLDHMFLRVDVPGGIAKMVAPRKHPATLPAEGVLENAVKFLGITCDACKQPNIAGTRWKCALCVDYDLCTTCYKGGEHDLDHTFLRVNVPGATAVRVAPRRRSGSIPVEPIFDEGAIFPGVNCDGCNERGIVGPRWKCTVCNDYDLCTACYMAKMHNFDHVFLRFEAPGRRGLKVSPRQQFFSAEDRATQEVVLFRGIYCDSCDEQDIVGPLWKCDSCHNYDLCTTCYMDGVHDLDHWFLRFDAPASRGDKVLPRIKCGLFDEVLGDSEEAKLEQRATKFVGINCRGCGQRDILGKRWKCAVCFDYDLCSACYRGDEHDLDHVFLRFDEPGDIGVHVLPREASTNAQPWVNTVEDEDNSEDWNNEEHESPDGDHDSREELVTKLRELEDGVQSMVCMEGLRYVAFLCGHNAGADCAENLSVCNLCRDTMGKKLALH